MQKHKKNSEKYYFQPTFGNRPERIVGREGELLAFKNALSLPIGSRERCRLIFGQRGMGKTALLLEMSDIAADAGYVVARVTAHEGMASAIIEQIQLNGSSLFGDEKRHLSGVNAGVLGFSFGLAFSEPAQNQYGFRAKLSLLCDKLAEKEKGILILIDEVHTSEAMREVAAGYQELVEDRKDIAICMAGLPSAVSGVFNDKVLTFLNRAEKTNLGGISVSAIHAYYVHAFHAMGIEYNEDLLNEAAKATRGLPYLMQLIGYYLVQYSRDEHRMDKDILARAESAAVMDLEANVFEPTLAPLSDNDRIFLQAMAECGSPVTTAALKERLGQDGPAIQPYRKRLLETGIVEAPRRGELTFSIPYFEEYLRKEV